MQVSRPTSSILQDTPNVAPAAVANDGAVENQWSLADAISFASQWPSKDEMIASKPSNMDDHTWEEVLVVYDLQKQHGTDLHVIHGLLVAHFETGVQDDGKNEIPAEILGDNKDTQIVGNKDPQASGDIKEVPGKTLPSQISQDDHDGDKKTQAVGVEESTPATNVESPKDVGPPLNKLESYTSQLPDSETIDLCSEFGDMEIEPQSSEPKPLPVISGCPPGLVAEVVGYLEKMKIPSGMSPWLPALLMNGWKTKFRKQWKPWIHCPCHGMTLLRYMMIMMWLK